MYFVVNLLNYSSNQLTSKRTPFNSFKNTENEQLESVDGHGKAEVGSALYSLLLFMFHYF